MKKMITIVSLILAAALILPAAIIPASADYYFGDGVTYFYDGAIVSGEILIGLNYHEDLQGMRFYAYYSDDPTETEKTSLYGSAKVGDVADLCEILNIPFSLSGAELLSVSGRADADGKFTPNGKACFCLKLRGITVDEAIWALYENPYIEYAEPNFIYGLDGGDNTPSVPAGPFRDVEIDDWYFENVKCVYEIGLMVGMEKDLFGPDVKLTRAMAVTVMFRLHQKMGDYGLVNCFVTDFPSGFEDVPEGAWYSDALNWARLASVVQGRTEKIFDPEGQITRAEFSAMLGRYLVNLCDHHVLKTKGNAKAEEKLTDWNKIPEFARNKVDFLFWNGLIKGKENGKFDPDAPITRAEIAAILDRTIRFTEDNLIN
ncbi:MAG: S-layer homology domain-containing protein [Clostridia bacterium]|nr:S-layer homology domain-containing protein [Clostridia bacterium]